MAKTETKVSGSRGFEVTDAMHNEFGRLGTAGACLAVRDAETGRVSFVKAVETEHHDDADGSFTTWLVTEDV